MRNRSFAGDVVLTLDRAPKSLELVSLRLFQNVRLIWPAGCFPMRLSLGLVTALALKVAGETISQVGE